MHDLLTRFGADVTRAINGHLDSLQVSCYLWRIGVDHDRQVEALTCKQAAYNNNNNNNNNNGRTVSP